MNSSQEIARDIQSIYSDGRVWEGSIDLPESSAHELSAALVSCERAGTSIAGLIGLFAAPVAFLTARALHKATLAVLGASAVTATQWFAASIKGVEYALLSLAITWLVKRDAAWKLYVIAGALVEVSHPIGCALAVRFSSQVNARLRD